MTKYVVAIEYTEPEWDARQEVPLGPRVGTFVVEARDEAGARRTAIDEFRRMALYSWVGWHREIGAVVVTRVEGDA
jgi:hypothetical protein